MDPARNPALEIDWQPKYPYVPSSRSRITQLSDSVEKILRGVENIDVDRLVQGLEKSLTTITKVAEGANFEKLGNQANQFLIEVRENQSSIKDLIGSPDLKTAFTDGAAAAKTAREIIDNAEKPLKQLLADLPHATKRASIAWLSGSTTCRAIYLKKQRAVTPNAPPAQPVVGGPAAGDSEHHR